ncbi:MAG: hypothetical protein O7H41_14985 [Planctomycetota bacterium]|nr:hypothetical protein [Planctomycetota bacterium]
MGENYRIKTSIGAAEFEAEGTKKDVREDYQKFLDAVRVVGQAALAPSHENAGKQQREGEGDNPPKRGPVTRPSDADLKRIYDDDNGRLSLLVQTDGEDAMLDGVLALLFGYRTLLEESNIKTLALKEGVEKSGLVFERMDRLAGANRTLIRSGGVKKGKTYSATNAGLLRGRKVFDSLCE